MLINERLFKEIASRGVSQKTWDSFTELEKQAYIKKNPTSKYADKLNKDNYNYSYQRLTPEMRECLKSCGAEEIIENKDGTIYITSYHTLFDINAEDFDKVFLDDKGHLKINFYKCNGDFCLPENSKISSLDGCPKEVGGCFNCSYCNSLKSLKGAPEKVGKAFYCNNCKSLKSLEGCSKEVIGSFICSNCSNLKTLNGAPEKVGRDFNCKNCTSLETLDGCPKIVKEFNCSGCSNLTSLKGCPKKVSNDFICYNCGKQFKEIEVRRQYCSVGYRVINKE